MSQLAGFAKSPDLAFFLSELCGASYVHELRLAPTPELLSAYRSEHFTWPEYEKRFIELMSERSVPEVLDRASFAEKTVLLCSEPTPERCHRRLVAEILAERWNLRIEHL